MDHSNRTFESGLNQTHPPTPNQSPPILSNLQHKERTNSRESCSACQSPSTTTNSTLSSYSNTTTTSSSEFKSDDSFCNIGHDLSIKRRRLTAMDNGDAGKLPCQTNDQAMYNLCQTTLGCDRQLMTSSPIRPLKVKSPDCEADLVVRQLIVDATGKQQIETLIQGQQKTTNCMNGVHSDVIGVLQPHNALSTNVEELIEDSDEKLDPCSRSSTSSANFEINNSFLKDFSTKPKHSASNSLDFGTPVSSMSSNIAPCLANNFVQCARLIQPTNPSTDTPPPFETYLRTLQLLCTISTQSNVNLDLNRQEHNVCDEQTEAIDLVVDKPSKSSTNVESNNLIGQLPSRHQPIIDLNSRSLVPHYNEIIGHFTSNNSSIINHHIHSRRRKTKVTDSRIHNNNNNLGSIPDARINSSSNNNFINRPRSFTEPFNRLGSQLSPIDFRISSKAPFNIQSLPDNNSSSGTDPSQFCSQSLKKVDREPATRHRSPCNSIKGIDLLSRAWKSSVNSAKASPYCNTAVLSKENIDKSPEQYNIGSHLNSTASPPGNHQDNIVRSSFDSLANLNQLLLNNSNSRNGIDPSRSSRMTIPNNSRYQKSFNYQSTHSLMSFLKTTRPEKTLASRSESRQALIGSQSGPTRLLVGSSTNRQSLTSFDEEEAEALLHYNEGARLTSTLTPVHLRKAKLMFFYARYPNSTLLKMYFPDIKFYKNNTAQLVKWFSNFREFYYIQMEKFARVAISEGIRLPDDIHVTTECELYRALNLHYNRNQQLEIPEHFRLVVEATLREFFNALVTNKDSEQSWKKPIYKVIARMDQPVPEFFKNPNWMQQLADN